MGNLHIKFRYKDEFSRGTWSYQECYCGSVEECKKFYGADECEAFEILLVEPAEQISTNESV